MAAVYDIQVRNALYTYERALVGYPISTQRRKIKVKRLRSFLQALSRNVDAYPTCNSKMLGQFFDVDGNPIFPNLKQSNYEDESGTQWRMSFFRISANMVKIYRLYQSASIDESKLKKKIIIENNNVTNKFRNMNNKKVVRLTESQLHNIIAESVSQILNELDWKTYKSAANADERIAMQSRNEYNKRLGKDIDDEETKRLYKRYLKGLGRSGRFDATATNAFNRDYGYKNDEGESYTADMTGGDWRTPASFAYNKEQSKKGHIYPLRKEFGYFYNAPSSLNYNDWKQGASEELLNAKEKGDNELAKFFNKKDGGYRYVKGKGWQ